MLAKLYAVNPWVAYGVPLLAILAAAELGRFVGVARRRHRAALRCRQRSLHWRPRCSPCSR
jgi:hypothetical protein